MQNINTDLQIDENLNDLTIERYRLLLTQDVEAIRQRIEIRLRVFLNEWFLNPDFGVDYYGVAFQKNPDIFLIEAIIRSQILSVPLVNELTEFNLDFNAQKRSANINFKVDTVLGETTGQIEL